MIINRTASPVNWATKFIVNRNTYASGRCHRRGRRRSCYRWYGARALLSLRLEKLGCVDDGIPTDFNAIESGMDASLTGIKILLVKMQR